MTIIRGKLRDRPCGPRSIVVGKSDFKRVGDKWFDKDGNECEVQDLAYFLCDHDFRNLLVSDIGPKENWEYAETCLNCGNRKKESV
jgi:hypothetical protein